MTKPIHDRGPMSPIEVAQLQRVFDTACAARSLLQHWTKAHDIARTILALRNTGMQEEAGLNDTPSFRRETPRAG